MDLMKGVEVENLQTRCVIVFIKTMFFIVILHQVSSAFPKSASGAGDINFDNNINFCGITMKITPTTISTITTITRWAVWHQACSSALSVLRFKVT